MNGNIQGRRQRPISVMGVGVDLFSADAEEKEDCLPSVSFQFKPSRSINYSKMLVD